MCVNPVSGRQKQQDEQPHQAALKDDYCANTIFLLIPIKALAPVGSSLILDLEFTNLLLNLSLFFSLSLSLSVALSPSFLPGLVFCYIKHIWNATESNQVGGKKIDLFFLLCFFFLQPPCLRLSFPWHGTLSHAAPAINSICLQF